MKLERCVRSQAPGYCDEAADHKSFPHCVAREISRDSLPCHPARFAAMSREVEDEVEHEVRPPVQERVVHFVLIGRGAQPRLGQTDHGYTVLTLDVKVDGHLDWLTVFVLAVVFGPAEPGRSVEDVNWSLALTSRPRDSQIAPPPPRGLIVASSGDQSSTSVGSVRTGKTSSRRSLVVAPAARASPSKRAVVLLHELPVSVGHFV